MKSRMATLRPLTVLSGFPLDTLLHLHVPLVFCYFCWLDTFTDLLIETIGLIKSVERFKEDDRTL